MDLLDSFDAAWGIVDDESCAIADSLVSASPSETASNLPSMCGQLRRGTFLDETINLAGAEGDLLAQQILALLPPVRNRDVANHCARVRSVIANGLRCYWHRELPTVSYFRKADGYSKKLHKPHLADRKRSRCIGR